MNQNNLYVKIFLLPDNLKSEVVDFIETLLIKMKQSLEKKKPVFGCGNGVFVMHDDFDEPMEDFNGFMQ